VDDLAGQTQAYLSDNRENVRQSVASVRDLTASINDIVVKDRGKVEKLLDGLELSRARADRVLYQTDQIAGQVGTMLARSGSEIERSVTNVRDATDWANKLTHKLYTNPFVLGPFYKPSHEDMRVQSVFDTATEFNKGAAELKDAVKTLEAMAARPATQVQQQEILSLQQTVRMLTGQLSETSSRLAEAMKRPAAGGRVLR
jgi:phospholipid/cholesterol/gamma-HCH transport system substrate-binding protein